MTFPRGFKAEANRISLEVREELGLEPHSPLCPWDLAENLAIPVLTLNALATQAPEIAGHVDHLTQVQPGVFSAITIFDGHRRTVIHNDGHARTRQRANLAHEMAHALLQHPAHPPFCGQGKRVFDKRLEDEASWLGPCLLVSNEAAHWALRSGLSYDAAARHFEVSLDLMRFRMNASGGARLTGRRRT